MSLALDSSDDTGPVDQYGNNVKDYLKNAIGSWLYITDYARRNDTPGGLSPEGSMYSDLGFKFEMQFRLGLVTAGEVNPTKWGEQVNFHGHPFWDYVVPAYLHSLPPSPTTYYNWQGPVYEPAWYGDGQDSYQRDITGALGAIAEETNFHTDFPPFFPAQR
jgi:hypothetical protein